MGCAETSDEYGTHLMMEIVAAFNARAESEFMKNLSKSNDLNLIEKFNNTYMYLDDLCSLDNTLFQTYITAIYFNFYFYLQSNSSDDKATFLDVDIQIHNLHCTIKIYDKRDDFDFDIVNFPSCYCDIPSRPSYGALN